MSYTVILHIHNSDPVVGEVEKLPSPTDTIIGVNNPRMRDGKSLRYLADNAVTVYWPINRLIFIEVITGEDEAEEIIGFVRENFDE